MNPEEISRIMKQIQYDMEQPLIYGEILRPWEFDGKGFYYRTHYASSIKVLEIH